jgi:hypothetical protein
VRCGRGSLPGRFGRPLLLPWQDSIRGEFPGRSPRASPGEIVRRQPSRAERCPSDTRC